MESRLIGTMCKDLLRLSCETATSRPDFLGCIGYTQEVEVEFDYLHLLIEFAPAYSIPQELLVPEHIRFCEIDGALRIKDRLVARGAGHKLSLIVGRSLLSCRSGVYNDRKEAVYSGVIPHIILEACGMSKTDAEALRLFPPLAVVGCLGLRLHDNKYERLVQLRLRVPPSAVDFLLEAIHSRASLENEDLGRFFSGYFERQLRDISEDILRAVRVEESGEAPFVENFFVSSRCARLASDICTNRYYLIRSLDACESHPDLLGYKAVLEKVLNDGRARYYPHDVGLPTLRPEQPAIIDVASRVGGGFDEGQLIKWVMHELYKETYARLGLSIVILSALYDGLRRLYVSRILHFTVPEFVQLCAEVQDFARLCNPFVTDIEVKNIVNTRGLMFCAEAAQAKGFRWTNAHNIPCNNLRVRREVRDNVVNKCAVPMGDTPFHMLSQRSSYLHRFLGFVGNFLDIWGPHCVGNPAGLRSLLKSRLEGLRPDFYRGVAVFCGSIYSRRWRVVVPCQFSEGCR
ncbi:MAG: hypothetical protein ACTJLL_01935 [Anaplasma sp.]